MKIERKIIFWRKKPQTFPSENETKRTQFPLNFLVLRFDNMLMIPVDSPETMQQMSACLRSAIPSDQLYWDAIPSLVLREIILRIIHTPEFSELKTLREQIDILTQILMKNEGNTHLTWKTISDFFGLNGK
jgi:hypothetical protein